MIDDQMTFLFLHPKPSMASSLPTEKSVGFGLPCQASGAGSPPSNGDWPYKPRAGEYFLRGPIPMDWLAAAANEGGKALHVGLLLWFLAQMTRRRTVRVEAKFQTWFGVSRQAYYRGLAALEAKGLVRCERYPNRRAAITLIPRWKGDRHD